MAATAQEILEELKKLLERVKKEIHQALDLVCYAMNGFIIGVGPCDASD